MKKLPLLFLLLLPSNSFAYTISIQPFISGNDVSIAALETQRTTLQNVINTGIEGGGQNIRQGSITSYDLATAVNPVVRFDEAFNDFTFSGMLPPTSVTLSSTISAGVSYVNGVRIQTSATAHSFTASKDTYLYINAGGYFDYVEVVNGGTAPSTPANDLLLAKVVTNGTAVTSVTDSRTLSIQIVSNSSNFASDYRDQAFVSYDSTTAMHIEPGQFAIGGSYYTNTSDTPSRSTATATNWIEGSVPNLSNLNVYVYAYNNSGTSFDFKYASADPVYSDTNSNTNGTLRYYTTGGTTYRALGWAYISADGTGILEKSSGNFSDKGIINQAKFETGAVGTTTIVIPADDTIPQSNEGLEFMALTFKPTNVNSTLKIDVTVFGGEASDVSNVFVAALFKNSDTSAMAAGMSKGPTGASILAGQCSFTHYMTATSTTPIRFSVRVGMDSGGTFTFNGASGRLLGGVMASSITVTELSGG